jgi:AraC-like DNA-binding protein
MLEGTARISSAGATVQLAPGDVLITDSRHEFMFDLRSPARRLVIQLPAAQLDGRVVNPEALAGAVFRDGPLARLWARNLAAGFALSGELSAPAAALFARHCVELLTELVGESAGEHGALSEAAGGAVYFNACRVIAARLDDPSLTPVAIARAVGVSSRTLARAFAARGEAVMRRVFDERIAHAARLLASPQHADRSITDVAFSCGFNDLSHFGRLFARKAGMAPSQWRRAADLAPGARALRQCVIE